MRKYALPTAILVLSLLALTLACRPAADDNAARLARLEADNAALATRVAGSDTAAADYAALADRLATLEGKIDRQSEIIAELTGMLMAPTMAGIPAMPGALPLLDAQAAADLDDYIAQLETRPARFSLDDTAADHYRRILVDAAADCVASAPTTAELDETRMRRAVRLEAERSLNDQDLVNMNLTYCVAMAPPADFPSPDSAGDVDPALVTRLRECAAAMSPADAGDLAGDRAIVAQMLSILATEIRPAAVDAYCADSAASQG